MLGLGRRGAFALAASGALALCSVGHGCDADGTDTGNPVAHIGGCKKYDEEALSVQALTRAETDPATYKGLHCMRWERSGEQVRFDVFNLSGPCYVFWEGRSKRRKDGGLDLVLRNSACQQAACGGCLYDASFEIEAAQIDGDDATVGLLMDNCDDDLDKAGSWQLHSGKNASSLVCEYADAMGVREQRDMYGRCGEANMPCIGANSSCEWYGLDAGVDRGQCDSGLTCTDVGGGDPRCLVDCKGDADCPLPDVMACDDGVCRLQVK
jgi:hypothetical protein